MEELFFCPSCMAKLTSADGKCPFCGSELNIENAPHQLPVNSILNGRYLVGKVLGAGGFGITYIGYDLRLDGKVAIKEYYPSGAANRSMSLTVFPTNAVKNNPFDLGKSRFLTEAKTLSEFVEDGNIVTLRDYFEENGTAYIVMEYLEGEDLSHYAKKHGILEMDEVLALLEPAMLALDKVHKKGLVHRDISPSNIMVLSDGRVKVLDFGSARLQNASGEQSLTVMLKHGYAPEEQYRPHGEQGPWTDVYAMSATIYKLITGKTPPAATERMFEDTLVPPSKLGAKLTPAQERALLHGLALRAPDRTQSMAELAASLRTKKKAPAVKAEKPKKEKPPKEPKPPKPEKPPRPPKPEKPPKPPKPVKEPKKKEKPQKPEESVKAPEKKEKPAKPAITKKRALALTAALLAVLALCIAVFMPKKSAVTADTLDTQAEPAPSLAPHLDELAAARKAIAGRGETTISAGRATTAGLKNDGTVLAVGNNENGQCNILDWADIVAVSAGSSHTVGLKPDGTVVAVGSNAYGQCDISDWTDIIAVAAGGNHTVGLCLDGTVVAAGNNADGRCDVSDWTDIIAVSASASGTVGLKSDGTVIAVGSNSYSQCDVSGWTGIVAVSAGDFHTVGLKSDGTVVAVGSNSWGKCDVSDWTDIAAVSAGDLHTVGLKSDGTVVAIGDNGDSYGGNYDVSDWTDIVAVSTGYDHTVGLKADGTVVTAGRNFYGQCEVSGWANIRIPEGVEAADPAEQQKLAELAAARAAIASHSETTISAGEWTTGIKSDGTVVTTGLRDSFTGWTDMSAISTSSNSKDTHTIGLKTDGTVIAYGKNIKGQCDVNDWKNITAVSAGYEFTIGLRSDGTVAATGDNGDGQCGVSDWTGIVAVDAGWYHAVGLKADGTVVAVGSSDKNQCGVQNWTDIIAISAGGKHTVGLRLDGTVVAVGDNQYGQCDVGSWTDIVAVSAGYLHTVGLKADGTVVAVGQNNTAGWGSSGSYTGQCDVSDWADIVAVSAGTDDTVGLRSDGTVAAAGHTYSFSYDGGVDGWAFIMLPE